MDAIKMMEISAIAWHLKISSSDLLLLPNGKFGLNGRQYYLKYRQEGSYRVYKVLSTKIK